MGAPTGTVVPSSTSTLSTVASASASMSTAALSVSTVAIGSAGVTGEFSATDQLARMASVVPAATSGMRNRRAMSLLLDLDELGHDLTCLRDGRAFQDLADARRGLASGEALHGGVEPVEEP